MSPVLRDPALSMPCAKSFFSTWLKTVSLPTGPFVFGFPAAPPGKKSLFHGHGPFWSTSPAPMQYLRAPEFRAIQYSPTDISDPPHSIARAGVYQTPFSRHVAQRLKRFFMRVEKGYQILQSVREVLFLAKAKHHQRHRPSPAWISSVVATCLSILAPSSRTRHSHHALRP